MTRGATQHRQGDSRNSGTTVAFATVFAIALLLCGAAAACFEGGNTATGSERGHCYPNGTCDDGLVCLSDRCVRWPDDGTPDAFVVPFPDAEIAIPDASLPDASSDPNPGPTHEGRLTLADLRAASADPPRQGLYALIRFLEIGDESATKIYDDRDPLGIGCAAWVYDLGAAQLPPVYEDHGVVTFAGATAVLPSCVFVGSFYICPSSNGDAVHLVIGDGGAQGIFELTDTDALFSVDDIGRYIAINVIGGGDDHPWQGAFAITGLVSPTTIVVANDDPAAQLDAYWAGAPGIGAGPGALDPATTYAILAGAGSVPNYGGGLADDDEVTVTLDAPDGDRFDAFTTSPIPAGDEFSMSGAQLAQLTDIPVDGSEMTFSCDQCGTAVITQANLEFNDGALDDLLAAHTGNGPSFLYSPGGGAAGDKLLTIEHDGNFSPAYFGDWLTTCGADAIDPDNNVEGQIIAADADHVAVIVTAKATTAPFDSTSCYRVSKQHAGLPDLATATMTGKISCAQLAGPSVVLPAEASSALTVVQPTRIETEYLRSGLGVETNADMTAVTWILVGHGIYGYTDPGN